VGRFADKWLSVIMSAVVKAMRK